MLRGVMALLKPVEFVYRGINRARRSLYQRGVFESRQLPLPVVSVGNIVMGGGGKTPTTIALANALLERGLSPAILSRGYGGRLTDRVGTLVDDSFDVSLFGDEPVLMAKRVPGAHVVVGAKRWASGIAYLAQHDCDLFILDDGFQHVQLKRDLDIVLDHPSARWQREGRSTLQVADIVLRRVHDATEDRDDTMRLEIRTVRHGVGSRPVETLRDERVYVVSGLADNGQFQRAVAGLGAEIAGSVEYGDHHAYRPAEIDAIVDEARRLDALPVTTEKDAVKMNNETIAVLEAVAVIPSLPAIVDRIEEIARASAELTGQL